MMDSSPTLLSRHSMINLAGTQRLSFGWQGQEKAAERCVRTPLQGGFVEALIETCGADAGDEGINSLHWNRNFMRESMRERNPGNCPVMMGIHRDEPKLLERLGSIVIATISHHTDLAGMDQLSVLTGQVCLGLGLGWGGVCGVGGGGGGGGGCMSMTFLSNDRYCLLCACATISLPHHTYIDPSIATTPPSPTQILSLTLVPDSLSVQKAGSQAFTRHRVSWMLKGGGRAGTRSGLAAASTSSSRLFSGGGIDWGKITAERHALVFRHTAPSGSSALANAVFEAKYLPKQLRLYHVRRKTTVGRAVMDLSGEGKGDEQAPPEGARKAKAKDKGKAKTKEKGKAKAKGKGKGKEKGKGKASSTKASPAPEKTKRRKHFETGNSRTTHWLSNHPYGPHGGALFLHTPIIEGVRLMGVQALYQGGITGGANTSVRVIKLNTMYENIDCGSYLDYQGQGGRLRAGKEVRLISARLDLS